METSSSNASFGYWVRRRRKALDLTQEELAAQVNCSGALIRKIEADERRPSRTIAELLVKALAIEPAEAATFLRVARGEQAVSHLARAALPPLTRAEATAATQPAAVTLPPGPLPLPPNPLVGRQVELTTLRQLLHDPDCRLLTIAGVGGMGKTRLALTLAHQVQGDFADGAFFVNLAAIEHPTLVATALANTLGLTFAGPTPPEAQVASHLRHKQILLVLDNFEHLLAGATFVGELVATAPRLKVLVTSREPLGLQAEWVFILNGLATVPTAQPNVEADAAPALVSAVELFLQRANQIAVGFRLTAANVEAIQQICQLVEGLPLAIELAATWVRTLNCTEIARQIAQDSHFLATHGPLVRDLPARHRSITGVFDHSWRLLNADEQQTLKQLAVFQGSFTPAAAQAVTGAALATLAALVTKSLVRMNDGRYDLHVLVRQFAAAQWTDETQLRVTQRRHAAYYLALLRQREAALQGPTQLTVLDELKREAGNLRLAWAQAGMLGLWKPLWLATRCYWAFYDWQGLAHEGNATLTPLIEQLTPQADTAEKQRTLGRLLCYSGFFYFRQGDNGPAHRYLESSIRLLRTLDEPALLIDPLIFHGVVLFLLGDTAAAHAALAEGLAYAQAAHDEWFEALALLNRGYLAMFVEATPAIYADMQRALAIWRRLGGPRTIALALNYLSPVAIQLGRFADAQRFLDECLPLAQTIGDRWLIGTAHSHQAMLAHAQGALAKAEDAYQAAIRLFAELHLLRDLAIAQVFLAEVQMDRGTAAVAHETLLAGLRLAVQIGATPTALAALLDLALLPVTDAPDQRLLLVAFVRQHPVKTQRLVRDTEQLWTTLTAQLTPDVIMAIQSRAQSLTLEALIAAVLPESQ